MNSNPYAAPKARLRDPAPHRAITEKPNEIRNAVWLLWLCVPLWIPAAIHEYLRAPADAKSATAVLMILLFLFFVVLIVFIDRGHNWARVAFLVMTLFAISSLVGLYAEFLDYPILYLGLNVVLLLLDVLVIYLLFTRPGALWFKRIR